MKFCPILQGSRQCYKFFINSWSISMINYIFRLHVKSFIPTTRDPSFVLPESHFAGTKFSHVIASAHLSGMKNLISQSVLKNLQKYISIDRSYFYCIFTTRVTSICEKKVKKFHHFVKIFKSVGIYGVFLNKYKVETCLALPG